MKRSTLDFDRYVQRSKSRGHRRLYIYLLDALQRML